MKIACVQINSGRDIAANIARLETLVGEAAAQGAELIALPENAFLMEAPGGERVFYTQDAHPAVAASAQMAKRYGIWLLAGSIAVIPVIPSAAEGSSFGAEEKDPSATLRFAQDDNKTYNRSLLFNPQGEITAHYDKIHLFDVEVGDGQTYRESAKMLSGDKMVVAEVDVGMWGCGEGEKVRSSSHPHIPTSPHPTLGLTICYDLRFPHLYRALAKAGADILAVPSAFTQVTGEAHWHVLLRARAIENGCFVIAPAQCGTHSGGRKTYGHSLIVDPWGKILADAGTEEGVIVVDVDMDLVKKTRAKLPSLEHDRPFEGYNNQY